MPGKGWEVCPLSRRGGGGWCWVDGPNAVWERVGGVRPIGTMYSCRRMTVNAN
jgi:hypothetical protein